MRKVGVVVIVIVWIEEWIYFCNCRKFESYGIEYCLYVRWWYFGLVVDLWVWKSWLYIVGIVWVFFWLYLG